MESHAKYTLVGAVVILMTVLIVVAVLWLSEAGALRHVNYYSIYFRNHSLNGLQVDSAVTMRGIKVGSVSSLGIADENIEQVRVVIILDAQTPVKTDTVALINRNMLTGFAYLDLARGTQNAPKLTEKPPDEEYPIIPEANSQLEQLADSLPEVLDRANELVSRVATLISDENIQLIGSSIKNIEATTAMFAKNKDSFEKIFKKAEIAADEITKVSRAFAEFAGPDNSRLSAISEEFLASLQELRNVVTNFKEQSADLMNGLTGSTQILTQQASAASQSLGDASRAASATLEGFQQPRKILSGPHPRALGPGEGSQ